MRSNVAMTRNNVALTRSNVALTRSNVALTRSNVAPDAQQRCDDTQQRRAARSRRGADAQQRCDDAQQRCAASLRMCAHVASALQTGLSPRGHLTRRLILPILPATTSKIVRPPLLAAVGGTGVLESTSDLYRRGS
jgi:hypothetical protein